MRRSQKILTRPEWSINRAYYKSMDYAVMAEPLPMLHGDALTVTGKTMAQNLANAFSPDNEVIKTLASPFLTSASSLSPLTRERS